MFATKSAKVPSAKYFEGFGDCAAWIRERIRSIAASPIYTEHERRGLLEALYQIDQLEDRLRQAIDAHEAANIARQLPCETDNDPGPELFDKGQ